MSNEKHPLLDLLDLTSLNSFLAVDNFKFFTKLKTALELDKQIVVEFDSEEASFEESITSTSELFQRDDMVLNAIIEAWANSTTSYLLSALNEHQGEAELTLNYEGWLSEAQMTFDDINEYVAGIDSDFLSDNITDIKEVLEEWKNTVAVISNTDELIAALDARLYG